MSAWSSRREGVTSYLISISSFHSFNGHLYQFCCYATSSEFFDNSKHGDVSPECATPVLFEFAYNDTSQLFRIRINRLVVIISRRIVMKSMG